MFSVFRRIPLELASKISKTYKTRLNILDVENLESISEDSDVDEAAPFIFKNDYYAHPLFNQEVREETNIYESDIDNDGKDENSQNETIPLLLKDDKNRD